MQLESFFICRHDTGAVLPLGKLFVYATGTTTPVSLYNASGVGIANPVIADANGLVSFAAADGTYDLLFQSADGSYTSPTLPKFQIFDLANLGGIPGSGSVASRSALAAITGQSAGAVRTLVEAGREGSFVWSASNLSACVTADPRQGIYVAPASDTTGASGAWVRVHQGRVTPFMFGAIDCTGAPKLSTEVVYDNLAALNGMWSIVLYLGVNRNVLITMDLSGCSGLGLSNTWVIDTGDSVNALWNRPTFTIIPGRLVAMARMVNLVQVSNGNYDVHGTWELWGGTDTQLNAGDYGARLIENGMLVAGQGGSRMGDVICQGAQRYAVAYTQDVSSNSIPSQWGRIIAIQCGCRNTDSVKFAGTYTGTWLNHPADNGSGAQRHRLTLPLPTSIDPNIIRIGDMLDLGTPGAGLLGGEFPVVVRNIVSVAAHSVTVDVWPYAPVESGGAFLGMFGGGVDFFGGNLANNTFELIETYSSGVGVRYASLFSPKVGSLLTESTLCAVQLGFNGGESMQGISIEHFHIESVFWSVIDYASCAQARFGVISAMPDDGRGMFSQVLRLDSNSISGSTFVSCQPVTPRGLTFNLNGGLVHMPYQSSGKSNDLGGLANNGSTTAGNAPENQRTNSFYTPNGFTFGLVAERSLADKSVKDRMFPFGPIYGPGPGGAPIGNIDFTATSQPGITVEGGSSYSIHPGQPGAIYGFAIYEPPPDNSDNGNWKIIYTRMISGYSAALSSGVAPIGASLLHAMPKDPATLSPAALYDVQQLNHLWQDTAGTIAAVVGTAVARVDDLSGGGNHLLQSTSAFRPILRKFAGTYYLEFDGSNDYLAASFVSCASPYTLITGWLIDNNGGGQQCLHCGTASITILRAQEGVGWDFYAGGTDVSGGTFDNAFHIHAGEFNGASSKWYQDDALILSGSVGTANFSGFIVGASNFPSSFVKGLWTGCGLFPLLSAANRKSASAWFAALTI